MAQVLESTREGTIPDNTDQLSPGELIPSTVVEPTPNRWSWVPSPTGVTGLEEWCLWLNFLDGLLTAHALAGGNQIEEINLLMRGAWAVSPVLYGTLKFWLFWFGLKMLERAAEKRGAHQVRVRVLRGVFVVFSLVVMWHLRVTALSH